MGHWINLSWLTHRDMSHSNQCSTTGMYYPVCGVDRVVHTKDSLLLIGKSSPDNIDRRWLIHSRRYRPQTACTFNIQFMQLLFFIRVISLCTASSIIKTNLFYAMSDCLYPANSYHEFVNMSAPQKCKCSTSVIETFSSTTMIYTIETYLMLILNFKLNKLNFQKHR